MGEVRANGVARAASAQTDGQSIPLGVGRVCVCVCVERLRLVLTYALRFALFVQQI